MDNRVILYNTYISNGERRELIHSGKNDAGAYATAFNAIRVASFLGVPCRTYVEHANRCGEVVTISPDLQSIKGGEIGYGKGKLDSGIPHDV